MLRAPASANARSAALMASGPVKTVTLESGSEQKCKAPNSASATVATGHRVGRRPAVVAALARARKARPDWGTQFSVAALAPEPDRTN
jgi:hypothetical protein